MQFLGRVSDADIRELYRRAAVTLLPGEEDFGIVPLEAQACGRPVVALGCGGALETVVPGETGILVSESTPEAFADGIARCHRAAVSTRRSSAVTPSASAATGSANEMAAQIAGAGRMVNRHNRLLVTFHVLSDALLGVTAFIIAYELRFHSGLISTLIPITKGMPPLQQHINVLPFIAVLVPLGFQLQGLYRLRRGRSRVDDFFAVFVGTHPRRRLRHRRDVVRADLLRDRRRAASAARFEVSQPVWAIFLVLNVDADVRGARARARVLERRWRAGIGLKRILIAGSGELGRLVADKIIEHRELGYQIIGFVDDKAPGDHLGYRGLPLLGTIDEAADIAARETIDHLYVALPPEQHVQMLQLIESTSRECVDVKVVPGSAAGHRAARAARRPRRRCRSSTSTTFRCRASTRSSSARIDIAISSAALLGLTIPFWIIAALVKLPSRGDVFYRQERMGLDGKPFMIYKFRSMTTAPRRRPDRCSPASSDPRRTPLGKLLRRSNIDELPQLWNVLRGDMSIVGPRPERPLFVAQFKDKIPQYMLRHKVKAGITGWAQVNGWRGNTSIEKRIEYDLYYIENWSVRLDLKIMWLTLLRGLLPQACLLMCGRLTAIGASDLL